MLEDSMSAPALQGSGLGHCFSRGSCFAASPIALGAVDALWLDASRGSGPDL